MLDVIVRDGVIVGESDWDGSSPAAWREYPKVAAHRFALLRTLVAVAAVALVLSAIPFRSEIPPLIESDYCYLLTAADRLVAGDGYGSTPPVAPLQPWTWEADWAFPTQWPCGYPLMIATVRVLFGLSTIDACRTISLVACAFALVGWFLFVRRSAPSGVTGWLIASVAAGCSVSTATFLNPSTDLLVVAALPFVLLQALGCVERESQPSGRMGDRPLGMSFLLCGFFAGALFWIRYAALFIPIALGGFLILQALSGRRLKRRHVVFFHVGAAIPIIALLTLNRLIGSAESTQAQLNLGHTMTTSFSPRLLLEAWATFTALPFYDYHWYASWFYALWPIGLLSALICLPQLRRSLRRFFREPAQRLSVCVVASLLVLLIAATALVGEKFHYVGLARYYTPIKPLYFSLFIAPVLLIPTRAIKALSVMTMLVACSWLVQQEWPGPYRRWLAAERETTPYGRWGNCFDPNSGDLYQWLGDQKEDKLIVVSNFHEYIALETKIPAIPIPPDRPTLDTWVDRIRATRGVEEVRVLFVLGPANKWRDYWIAPPDEIISRFGLSPYRNAPDTISAQVFSYSQHSPLDSSSVSRFSVPSRGL